MSGKLNSADSLNTFGRPVTVMIARLAYGGWEHAAVADWVTRTSLALSRDRRVKDFHPDTHSLWIDYSPVYAARNMAVEAARQHSADYLYLVDADMHPDVVPGAPRFHDLAFDWALAHPGPCLVNAPARNKQGQVCVHKVVEEDQTTEPDANYAGRRHLRLLEAQECAAKRGMEQAPACGMGLVLIDMRAFEKLSRPYFRFRYTDETQSVLATGEDVLFTADLGGPRVPVWIAWDCWCGHWKEGLIGKPQSRLLT